MTYDLHYIVLLGHVMTKETYMCAGENPGVSQLHGDCIFADSARFMFVNSTMHRTLLMLVCADYGGVLNIIVRMLVRYV